MGAREAIDELIDRIYELESDNQRLREALEGSVLLSGKGLSALESMASVDFMVKACAGSLTPVDVAESINGIIIDAKKKADQALQGKDTDGTPTQPQDDNS